MHGATMTRLTAAPLAPSAYQDTFAREHLPPPGQWPDFHFDLPALAYPERLNCVTWR
jgi:2-aminobenzoate-CoA ligase